MLTLTALSLALAPAPTSPDRLPADSALLQDFRETRHSLEKIVAMARDERGVERISTEFVRLTRNMSPSDTERRSRISDARWTQYKHLFAVARVPNGIGFSEGRVYFYKADIGLAGYGESKGFLWLAESTPLPVDEKDGPGFDKFRRIAAHWYLEHSRS